MASYKIPYRGVEESLHHLRKQVFDSIPYCIKNIPHFDTPEQLFNYLKSKVTYKNDPKGVELFQTAQTLLDNNWHGKSGLGDCDCFSILCLASLISQGFYNVGIVLAGRSKYNASHIYTYVDLGTTGRQILDLTNNKFNYERPYPYTQFIPFKISKNQIDMFLQLADQPLTRRKRKSRKAFTGSYDPYLWMQSKNIGVREDTLDDLPLQQFCDTMLSEGYSLEEIGELQGRRAQRVEKRQETKANKPRQVRKQEKHEIKISKKQGKIDTKASKAETKRIKEEGKADKRRSVGRSKETRAEAKRIKAESGEESPAVKLISKGGQYIGKIVDGKLQPQEQEEEIDEVESYGTPEDETDEPQSAEPTEQDETEQDDNAEELMDGNAFNIFGLVIPKQNFYLGLLVVGGILLTRKTRR